MKCKGKLILSELSVGQKFTCILWTVLFLLFNSFNELWDPGFVIWDFKLLSIHKEYYQRLPDTQNNWKERPAL